jgi:hypothetical protein
MPIRFTSPSLGGQRLVFLQAHQWEVGISYRNLTADDWFVGNKIQPSLAPGGKPNIFEIHSVDLSIEYGVTDRASLRLTIPFSTGTNSRIHPDNIRHITSATGIGDINLVANIWLLDPATHSARNLALGLGLKAPTGNNEVKGDFGLASGTVVQFPVHPGLQLGDGGWHIIVQVQAYQRLIRGLSAYIAGFYQLSPQGKTNVTFTPTSTLGRSLYDVYHGRFGLAYDLWPQAHVTSSLGVRFDGIPVRDIIGSDAGFRTPGYITYLDPGLSVSMGVSTFTLSVPLRLYGTFKKNTNDLQGGPPPSGDRGDLASHLVFLNYTYRF